MGAEEKARNAADKLTKATRKFAGTSHIDWGAEGGYTEESTEERAQETAEEQDVTLHRHADGSHTALDESKAALDPEAEDDDPSEESPG